MNTQHLKLKSFLEEAAAAWRTDALTVRTMGGRIKFGPEEAELIAELLIEAAQAISELLPDDPQRPTQGGAA